MGYYGEEEAFDAEAELKDMFDGDPDDGFTWGND